MRHCGHLASRIDIIGISKMPPNVCCVPFIGDRIKRHFETADHEIVAIIPNYSVVWSFLPSTQQVSKWEDYPKRGNTTSRRKTAFEIARRRRPMGRRISNSLRATTITMEEILRSARLCTFPIESAKSGFRGGSRLRLFCGHARCDAGDAALGAADRSHRSTYRISQAFNGDFFNRIGPKLTKDSRPTTRLGPS